MKKLLFEHGFVSERDWFLPFQDEDGTFGWHGGDLDLQGHHGRDGFKTLEDAITHAKAEGAQWAAMDAEVLAAL